MLGFEVSKDDLLNEFFHYFKKVSRLLLLKKKKKILAYLLRHEISDKNSHHLPISRMEIFSRQFNKLIEIMLTCVTSQLSRQITHSLPSQITTATLSTLGKSLSSQIPNLPHTNIDIDRRSRHAGNLIYISLQQKKKK